MTVLLNFMTAAILASCPLLFGTLGEIVTEKSGNLNLGVEGMMFMGAVGGLAGSYYYEINAATPSGVLSVIIGILCAAAAAALGALIYSIITITFRANQNVTGLALTIFGVGLGNFFGEYMGVKAGGYVAVGAVTKAAFNDPLFPGLATIPFIGKLLFSYNFLVYFAIVAAVAIGFFLKHTRKGLNLRAVGENPSTADAAGISVTRYKYAATLFGGALAGLGGLYVVMNNACGCGGVWTHDGISGYGWLSVALVIFATWSPSRAMLCALAFGGLNVMRYYYPSSWLPSAIYEILPYIATVVVLVVVGIRESKKNQPPASLGLSYFREER